MDPQQQQQQSAPPAAPDAHYQMPATNPGQTTGIIGLILAFVGLAPIGLVLSIISTVKSSGARAPKVLGVMGIALNALSMIILLFFIAVTIVAYSGVQTRANDSKTVTEANIVAKRAEAYKVENGSYPQTLADFSKYEVSQVDPEIPLVSSGPSDESEVYYRPCSATGARVAYLSHSSTIPVSIYLGTGSKVTCR